MRKKRSGGIGKSLFIAVGTGFLLTMAAAAWLQGDGAARKRETSVSPPFCLLYAGQTPEGLRVDVAGENLMLQKDVRVLADSVEDISFSPDLVRDGVSDESGSRWSSENDWEDTEHWLEVRFPRRTEVGCVRIFWERTNASAYCLEISEDGVQWRQVAAFGEAPEEREQYILLDEPVDTRYLRLHVTDVRKEEEDLSLYYQNISVLELEVYGALCDSFLIDRPQPEAGQGRYLEIPEVPTPYELRFGGADYGNLVRMDGKIADTLSPVSVELGFILERDGLEWHLPGMEVEIPASGRKEAGTSGDPSPEAAAMELPSGVETAEWCPDGGRMEVQPFFSVREKEGQGLEEIAALLTSGLEIWSEKIREEESKKGPEGRSGELVIDLELTEEGVSGAWENSLGEEGYEIEIRKEGILIRGNTSRGIRWGCVTLLDLLESESKSLPLGKIRDYPRYEVRGFGIDVGRRPVSMEMLWQIVEELSRHKMNTLQIHLNDNQIISQSDYDGTLEGARSLYAGFRLESDLKNEKGVGITAQDLYYTKEAFSALIERAAVYGVEIVPEIDTPAHSLALTRVFPEWGMQKDPESADCLDLSREGARELGKRLWAEYLTVEPAGGPEREPEAAEGKSPGEETAEAPAPVFAGCGTLHLGMDEYFGKAKDYYAYLQELSTYVSELAPDKNLRIWGSLTAIEGDLTGISRDLQIQIWNTDWADPQEMYGEGFSLINSLGSTLYLIPGGGYDRLDLSLLEEEWEPNLFLTQEQKWEIPAWSDRMLGACYMLWNDHAVSGEDGITEEDLMDRFREPLPVIAGKLW